MMEEMTNLTCPMDAIIAFRPELDRPMCHTVCYQVHLDPQNISPGGEYIRFDQYRQYTDAEGNIRQECVNEVHGWKKIDEIQILEVLEKFEQFEVEDVG